jgi:hypothetical protein
VALGVAPGERLVLVTLGGMADALQFPPESGEADLVFAVPGASEQARREANRLLLPHVGAVYHPDLVNACDAVIGKTGYSTVAEAYHAGVPFGYIDRPAFREAPVLARFIETEMGGFEVPAEVLRSGQWRAPALALLSQERRARGRPNGAEAAAEFIASLL